jgi:hypothetical protein
VTVTPYVDGVRQRMRPTVPNVMSVNNLIVGL